MARRSGGAGSETATTSRLADLQDRMRTIGQRITRIKEEILALSRETVDRRDLTNALSRFGPVWGSLAPREQARMISLLVERVGYDGEKGALAVTFRPNGIKALAREARLQGGEDQK